MAATAELRKQKALRLTPPPPRDSLEVLEVLLVFQPALRMGGAPGGPIILGAKSYTSHSTATPEPQSRFLCSGALISYSEGPEQNQNMSAPTGSSSDKRFKFKLNYLNDKNQLTSFFSSLFPLFVTPGDAFP